MMMMEDAAKCQYHKLATKATGRVYLRSRGWSCVCEVSCHGLLFCYFFFYLVSCVVDCLLLLLLLLLLILLLLLFDVWCFIFLKQT